MMTNPLTDRFRRWFELEMEAHASVRDSLAAVPDAGRTTPEFQRALAIFGHVVAARRVWLGRLGLAPPFQGALFPTEVDLEALRADLQDAERLWTDAFAALDDAALGRAVEYQSFDGKRYRNTAEEILAQLLTHSPYHRGQIAMLVRAAGGRPAVTDLIAFCRKPVV